jgi:hypothetical protein
MKEGVRRSPHRLWRTLGVCDLWSWIAQGVSEVYCNVVRLELCSGTQIGRIAGVT